MNSSILRVGGRALLVAACCFLAAHHVVSQWVQAGGPDGGSVNGLIVRSSVLFAGTDGGVFHSADNGATWAGVNGINASSLAYVGTNLFAGTYGYGVYLSEDNGSSWSITDTSLSNKLVYSVVVNGTTLFAGTYGGVFRTTNNGARWTSASSGLGNTNVRVLLFADANLFAGTYGGGVFRSVNNGASWSIADSGMLQNTYVQSLAENGTYLFAGTLGYGLYRSSDMGGHWMTSNAGLTNLFVYSLLVRGTNLFAGTAGGGLFLSTDNGTSWTPVNSGLPATGEIRSLVLTPDPSGYLFAGLTGALWRRPLSEMVTSVASSLDGVPQGIRLDQNYPNPFNPKTRLSFVIGQLSFVTIRVYDVVGREVATVLSGYKPPGEYTVSWDASGMASGIYLYRLTMGKETVTRKMVVTK